MRRLALFTLLCCPLFCALPAFAGFMELGASANYRYSGYNHDNYIQSSSYTASLSYYFWEMCAWELNYTTGYAKQVTKGNSVLDPKTTVEDNIQLTSLDLVLSLAERADFFRPYVKIGFGYLDKERFRKNNNDQTDKISDQYGMVPSGGIGFALSMTKEFNIKFGLDAWTSPIGKDPLVVDYAGRAGISWMF